MIGIKETATYKGNGQSIEVCERFYMGATALPEDIILKPIKVGGNWLFQSTKLPESVWGRNKDDEIIISYEDMTPPQSTKDGWDYKAIPPTIQEADPVRAALIGLSIGMVIGFIIGVSVFRYGIPLLT